MLSKSSWIRIVYLKIRESEYLFWKILEVVTSKMSVEILLSVFVMMWMLSNNIFWNILRKWIRSIPPGRQTVIFQLQMFSNLITIFVRYYTCASFSIFFKSNLHDQPESSRAIFANWLSLSMYFQSTFFINSLSSSIHFLHPFTWSFKLLKSIILFHLLFNLLQLLIIFVNIKTNWINICQIELLHKCLKPNNIK